MGIKVKEMNKLKGNSLKFAKERNSLRNQYSNSIINKNGGCSWLYVVWLENIIIKLKFYFVFIVISTLICYGFLLVRG